MEIAAVTAEYNPFHAGHRHHLAMTRAAGATHIVAIMSGNVTQRGDFALYDKFTRARAAVAGGADLVIELPAAYACAPATRFSDGAMQLAAGLGCVDSLSFGCENGSADAVKRAADVLSSDETGAAALKYIKSGMTYPKAFAKAAEELFPGSSSLFSNPNDLLAAEYVRAARARGFDPRLIAILRKGSPHDSAAPSEFLSAGELRRRLLSGSDPALLLPSGSLYGKKSGGLAAIAGALIYRLRTQGKAISLPDRADGVQDRLLASAACATDLESLLCAARTKRYTAARIRRAALCAAIGVTEESYRPIPYIRPLAANRRGLEILSLAKQKGLLPISPSLVKLRGLGGDAAFFSEFEAKVSDIYAMTFDPFLPSGLDYTEKFTVYGEHDGHNP